VSASQLLKNQSFECQIGLACHWQRVSLNFRSSSSCKVSPLEFVVLIKSSIIMRSIPSNKQCGKLHKYSKRLVAFEHDSSSSPTNILLWVGGLRDGLLTVSYPAILSQRLPKHWGLVQVALLSTLDGWGTSSLQRDVKELGQCVEYFHNLMGEKTKIVLMGHSTGCQDAMEYVTGCKKAFRVPLDGVILQAPVSDREALGSSLEESYDVIIKMAQSYMDQGRGEDVLPLSLGRSIFGRTPISAYRWLSLLSPNKDGDDDYFSSDLPTERLQQSFGNFKKQTPLLILCSGEDQNVPAHIDVSGLINRWTQVVEAGGGVVDLENSGIIKGAHHNFEEDDDEILNNLFERVIRFLEKVDSNQVDKSSQL
jgi:pimeloyl-ACP methyl ester carboxylesterase